jgi:CRISPR-associated protein Cmr3
VPVSGWDLKERRPKQIRYAVPAGSVYFFDVLDGPISRAAAESLWLRPIGDDLDGEEAGQNDRDGYGLAVPGTWDRDTTATALAVGPKTGSD